MKIDVTFFVDAYDLREAVGSTSNSDLLQDIVVLLQDVLYDDCDGPMLRGSFEVNSINGEKQ
tara:strand:- start:1248 stop:1433 length:186 start_codon:yes stop_codon:yes gene_type:complete